MPKPNARQRILAYLHSHPGVSAEEISRALLVTPANIRHHLSILVGDGRAALLGARRPDGRGRPVQVYGPGELHEGDGLSALADALLSKWLEALPPAQRETALRDLAARLAAQPHDRLVEAVARRLGPAIERLNALHYQARWEAHAQGPRIILEHCPYAAIIAGHPELCRMDAQLLSILLGANALQTAKLEMNARGVPFCQFVL